MVDHYTGAVMLVPQTGQTAQHVIEGLLQHWLPIHGMPRKLLTDRGKGFIALINRKIYDLLGITKLFTSRYHPQTDGKAERMVQEVKKQLRTFNLQLDNELIASKTPEQLDKAIELVYHEILTRNPSAEEADWAKQIIAEAKTPRDGIADLRWVMLNSNEFRFLP